jgi:hypothetical protein
MKNHAAQRGPAGGFCGPRSNTIAPLQFPVCWQREAAEICEGQAHRRTKVQYLVARRVPDRCNTFAGYA